MQVLIVDDEPDVVAMLVEHIRSSGGQAHGETSPKGALARLRAGEQYDVIVADIELGEVRGLELMRAIHALRADQLVVLITAFGSMELAAQAMRDGAADFIAKPFSLDVFSMVLARAVQTRQMRREIVRLRDALSPHTDDMIAVSPAMQQTLALAQRAAQSDATILITGESGVGKSLLARHIHGQSKRRLAPFVSINAATIPDGLVESELFGVKRGAFTDAREDREGVFQQARGGTLFFDEIAELGLPVQPKLLLALETGRVRPVGSSGEVSVDLRLIAATHQDLSALVSAGQFREDLFYRLHIVPIAIPPLRARPEDLPALVDHFVAQTCARMKRPLIGVSAPAMRWLCAQPWPGNARQLANTLERAIIMSEHDVLTLEDMQPLREDTPDVPSSLRALIARGRDHRM